MSNTEESYCRLCAELKPLNKLTNLQDNKDISQEILNKLSRFNIIMDFNENILPKTVCFECMISLERAFTFVTAVEQAQTVLSNLILVKIKRDDTNSDDENIYFEPHNESKGDMIKDENIVLEMKLNDDFTIINVSTNKSNNAEIKNLYDPNVDNGGVKDIIINEAQNLSPGYDIPINIVKDSLDCSDNKCKQAVTDQNEDIVVKKSKLLPKKLKKTKSGSTGASSEFINTQIKRLAAIPVKEIKMTWKDMSWKCSLCGTHYPNIDDLRKHSMECHETCNAYQCIDCNGKRYRLNLLLKHVHHHRKYLHYSCYICYEKFKSPHQARVHKATHINSFICPGCNTCFPNKTELNIHVNTYYKKFQKPKPQNHLGDNDLTCTICNKTYISKSGVYYHMLTHKDRKRDHICEICGKAFYLNINLKDHMVLHSEDRPYQCVICKFSFKTLSKLRYHAHVHSGLKPFSCDQCGKCFRQKYQLARHLTIHTDNLDFSCTFCNKKFRCHAFLQRHTLQHTGIKPYTCDICPRDFTNWANYNKHMKRKHGVDKTKRRRTPQGPHPVDPATGDVIYPDDMEQVLEWKKKMEEPMRSRNGGRPKLVKKIGSVECKEFNSESTVEPEESE